MIIVSEFVFSKIRKNTIFFCYVRRLVFGQICQVHFGSESRGGSLTIVPVSVNDPATVGASCTTDL